MAKKYDVIALGELLIDFTMNGQSEQGNNMFEACPGGALTLTDDTLEYVESQLSALNFYETFDKDITSAVISIVTTTFISAICSSISLMGVFVSVVPLFVYECTGLIQTAVLARLQYSFSGRYAVRTGIYIDNM